MGPPYSSPKATPQRSATSRLLAMKFMNRLGSGDSPLASAPSTPGSLAGGSREADARSGGSGRSSQKRRRAGDDAGDDDDDDNDDNDGSSGDNDSPSSAKRRRVSAAGSATASISAAAATTADLEASMRASLAEEERRRQAAVAKRAAELGDEHWTWSAPLPPHVAAKLAASTEAAGAARARMPFAVVRVGYAEIDNHAAEAAAAAEGSPDKRGSGGGSLARLVNSMKPGIMRFNMKTETPTKDPSADSDEVQENGQRSGSSKAARKKARAAGDAEKDKGRKKEAVKLKGLTSLSSQGGQNSMKCHRCGRSGHKAMECPSAQRRPGSKKR